VSIELLKEIVRRCHDYDQLGPASDSRFEEIEELVDAARSQIKLDTEALVTELGKANIRAGDMMDERDALRAECKTLQSELDKETSRADYNLAQCYDHAEALASKLAAKDAIHQSEIRALKEDLDRWKRYGVKGTLGK